MPDGKRAPSVHVREILTASEPAFRKAHAMLRKQFPRAEMLPFRDWVNSMREREIGLWTDTRWHLLVAEREGTVIGAASGSYLGNIAVGIVGYVAVLPGTRLNGLGPRMRRALHRCFKRDAREVSSGPLEAIVGEVRADNPWLRTLVRREGALALDFEYMQPSLDDHREPVPLVLYYQPLNGRQTLDAAYVRRLLYTMWRRMYRIATPMSRPEFRRMIRSLQGRRRIGHRDLDTIDISTQSAGRSTRRR
ncbi:MAG: GNAT family N-acetyltransferase [Gemmatimonadaceae bacterium]